MGRSGLTGFSALGAVVASQQPIDWRFLVTADKGIVLRPNSERLQSVVDQGPLGYSTLNQGVMGEVFRRGASPRGIVPLDFSNNYSRFEFGRQFLIGAGAEGLEEGYGVIAVARPTASGSPRFLFDHGKYADKGIGLALSTNRLLCYQPVPRRTRSEILSAAISVTDWAVVAAKVRFASGSQPGRVQLFLNGSSVASRTSNAVRVAADTINENRRRRGNSGPICIGLQSKTSYQQTRGFVGQLLALGICPWEQTELAMRALEDRYL